ncbi:uncharacterized protein LOC123538403 isoform X2 [Mercenaria mercenaria]|nr:uncharacterized protein LOC123538403 isoform X2 [Mercenaria mercenaria]
MNRFIPGTLASDVNFQVFLLDGVHRWNQDRQKEITTLENKAPLSYDGILQHSVNQLANVVLGKEIFPDFTIPGTYTGELIGSEYFYSQSTGTTVRYKEAEQSMEEEEDVEEDSTVEEDDSYDEPAIDDLTVPTLATTNIQRQSEPGRMCVRIPTEEDRQFQQELNQHLE